MSVPLLGWKPDTFDSRDYEFERSEIYGAPPVITSRDIDYRQWLSETDLQIAFNCCAHGVTGQAEGEANLNNAPIHKAAVLFPYANARLLEPEVAGQPRLIDRGSGLRLMYKSMAPKPDSDDDDRRGGYGLIADDRWPEIAENVNKAPPEDCYRAGENALIESYTRIPDGASSPDAMIAALRRKKLPTLCFMWDERAASIGSEVYDRPAGQVFGGHCVLVVGWIETMNAFLFQNSHGKDYGFEGGFGLVSASFVARASYDKWIATYRFEVLQ